MSATSALGLRLHRKFSKAPKERSMAQVFHPSINTFAKASMAAVGLGVVLLIFAAVAVDRSPYITQVGTSIPQEVPFSHQHHVGGLGIDCRYCHTSVETSSFAGIPSLSTCMTCHSQIWKDSPMLQPLRQAYAEDRPLAWNRVHNVPDYAYFRHDIHIHKGVACESCHGRVDQMPLTAKAQTLHMDWCLDCHRNPEKHVGPAEKVFEMGRAGETSAVVRAHLVKNFGIETQRLSDCATCHR